MIRVLLAEDQVLVRAGFRALLEATDGIDVVGEADDGVQAVDLALALRPDVTLMDVRMPLEDGLSATRRITAATPDVRVIVVTTFSLDEYLFEALRAGASGFLLKDTEPAELLQAIRVVHEGHALLSPAMTRRLVEEYAAHGKAPSASFGGLTEREREVLALVAAGLSNEEIGARLVVSSFTAKSHVSRAMAKLGARDRAQLVVLAYESGLVRPGWKD